jgi:hypothetical protein
MALEREFKRLVEAGTKPEDALDAADLFAAKASDAYALSEYGINIGSSIYDDAGARVVLGNTEQQAALGSIARKLYDLMGDALDNLEGQAAKNGAFVQRSTRAVTPVDLPPEVATEVAAIVATKPAKRVRPTRAPSTPESAAVVAREESERVDGVQTGVPAAAPDLWKALISRVTHRDPAQRDIIGSMMYRVLSNVFGDVDHITNAQVARLAGMSDEAGLGGFDPAYLASTSTPAFEELRRRFRLASEELTNGSDRADNSLNFAIDMLTNGKTEALNAELMASGVDRFSLTDNAADVGRNPLRDGDLSGYIQSLMRSGDDTGHKLYPHVKDNPYVSGIAQQAVDIMSGLRKDAGEAVAATPGKPTAVMMGDGTLYHPLFAVAGVTARLSRLPAKITDELLDLRTTTSGTLANNVAFIGADGVVQLRGSRAGLTTIDNEAIAELDDSIAKAVTAGDADGVAQLIVQRGAIAQQQGVVSDGVQAILLDPLKFYDPNSTSSASPAKAATIQAAIDAGDKLDPVLKRMGYIGVLTGGGEARLFNRPGAPGKGAASTYLEASIAHAQGLVRNRDAAGTPLTGELFLNMAVDAPAPNPLAVEQRALQAGAPAGIASMFANMFKKNKPTDGLTEAETTKVRTFSGVQLSTNAARIFKSGGEWLAESISPKEGTGFFEALQVRMMSDLHPRIADLDKLTGVDSWYKKVGYEVYRNLDMRGHTFPQSPPETRIAAALRSGSMEGLSMDERKAMSKINDHFRKLLIDQQEAGIPVADLTNGSNPYYLPQRFNMAWINANRAEAVTMLGNWFKKDRGNRPGAETAMEDARRVIHDAINKEELSGIVDSGNATYAQAFGDKLHKRQLNISGPDWESMAPMFDNNLRSLMSSYTEATHKRVEWTKRYGIRGHAINTYVDIGSRGSDAIQDALLGRAQGMKYMVGGRTAAEDGMSDVGGSVEVMDQLFSPIAADRTAADKIVADINDALAANSDAHSRSVIVENLINQFEVNGGSGVNHARLRVASIVNGMADFGTGGGTVASHELDFMLKMVGTMEGRPAFTLSANRGVRTTAQAIKTFNMITLLSGATLGSLADTVLPLMRSGSLGSTLKGTTKAVRLAMGDPATAEAMMRVGVLGESILNENMSHVNGGAMGRATNAFFQASLLTPWTNTMRQYAALVGFESIKANQTIVKRELAAGNTDSWQYRKSMRYLRQLGLGFLAENDKLDSFADAVAGSGGAVTESNLKVSEAIHKFVNESVFQPNRNDMPLWTQDPITSIFWQFKSFPTMMGRLVKRNFKEAVAYEKGGIVDKLKGKDVGKYAGDPAGLMYLLTLGAAAGGTAVAIKETIRGTNSEAEDGNWNSPRQYKLSKMGQEIGFKDFNIDDEGADAILGSYANGLLSLGALGFLGEMMFQSAKAVDNGSYGRERIMGQIAGPAFGLFNDTIQVVDGARNALKDEESNAKERTAVRKVLKRVPFVTLANPEVESLVNDIAGDSQTKPTTPMAIWDAWQ